MLARILFFSLLSYLLTGLSIFLYKLLTGFYDSFFPIPLFSSENVAGLFLCEIRPFLDYWADYYQDFFSIPFASPENRALVQAFNCVVQVTNLWRSEFPQKLPSGRRVCICALVFVNQFALFSLVLWKLSDIHNDKSSDWNQEIPSFLLEYADLVVSWTGENVDSRIIKLTITLVTLICGFISLVYFFYLKRSVPELTLEGLLETLRQRRLRFEDLRRQVDEQLLHNDEQQRAIGALLDDQRQEVVPPAA